MNARTIFVLLSFLLAVLYVVVSFRDFLGDLDFVFERRLFRGLKRHRFWLLALPLLMVVIAFNFREYAFLLFLIGVLGACGLVACSEWRTIIDVQVLRSIGWKFSLLRLLQLVTLFGLVFAGQRAAGGGVNGWIISTFAVGVLVATIVLIRVAVEDLRCTYEVADQQRRRDRTKPPQVTQAPVIRIEDE